MDPTEPGPAVRRSTGEWQFQLTTIALGVLIALSFDAVDANLASYGERLAELDSALQLLGESPAPS